MASLSSKKLLSEGERESCQHMRLNLRQSIDKDVFEDEGTDQVEQKEGRDLVRR